LAHPNVCVFIFSKFFFEETIFEASLHTEHTRVLTVISDWTLEHTGVLTVRAAMADCSGAALVYDMPECKLNFGTEHDFFHDPTVLVDKNYWTKVFDCL
jgi:hypothetical protein